MSLVKKHEMTEKHLAANRRNQKLCHGPVTAEGRERIRAAHLRHGFYAQAEEAALRALGEDPAQYPGTAGGTLGGMEARRRHAGGIGDPSAAVHVADESRRPHAGRLRRAAGPGHEQRAAGPAAREDDAAQDDGGEFGSCSSKR